MTTKNRKSDEERLDAVVNVRLSTAEKESLKLDAELAGLSVSELVRRRYFNRPIVSRTNLTAINELRRLGGLVKTIHNDSAGAYNQETYDVLVEIKKAIKELVK